MYVMTNKSAVEILLVEDNPDDAELTIRVLKKHNLANNLVHLHDGEEALKFLFENDMNIPKIILLDLKMPKVTGLEVLQQIKSDPALESIPVVIVTSAQDKAELQACFDLGINSWFRKPPEFAEFGKAVKEILEADDPSKSPR